MTDTPFIDQLRPAPPVVKQDGQCLRPVATLTEGPMVKAWCWENKCEWTKRFVFPETGIDIRKLQDEHDGAPRP